LTGAANSFAVGLEGPYDLRWSGAGKMESGDMIELAEAWVGKYPIVLWDDPLAENDWAGFKVFTDRLGGQIEVVGDDLFVTNIEYIRRGIAEGAANSSLIKLNQIGTVSESIAAGRLRAVLLEVSKEVTNDDVYLGRISGRNTSVQISAADGKLRP